MDAQGDADLLDLFGPYDLAGMNETDVREIIVRPLLHKLGYRQGTPANIVTEKKLHYSHAFLGRKKPKSDPPLTGRADYICEVVSYGRWVIEAKAPDHEINVEDVHQAHTYAAHPEIAAIFTVITNGREFHIYRVSGQEKPIFQWKTEETIRYLMNIRNLLGPDAIKRRVEVVADLRKPLALNYGSSIAIVGGQVTYDEHTSNSPLVQTTDMDGMKAAVVSGKIDRLEDGRIQGHLELAGPYTMFSALEEMGGIEPLIFTTSDEYLSTDQDAPSIFQNIVSWRVEAGTPLPAKVRSILPLSHLPFTAVSIASTEAIGYVDGSKIRGTFSISYNIKFSNIKHSLLRGRLPELAKIDGVGTFEVTIQ